MGYGDEHLENVELQRLLGALKLGSEFNPYEVIHTPADEPGTRTVVTSVRMHKDLLQAIKDVSGKGTRFKDASTAIRHAVALMLKVEFALFPEEAIYASLMPVLAWIDRENERINLEALDNVIRNAEGDIRQADGVKAKQEILNRLHNMYTHCEMRGYTRRMEDIRAILEYNQDR